MIKKMVLVGVVAAASLLSFRISAHRRAADVRVSPKAQACSIEDDKRGDNTCPCECCWYCDMHTPDECPSCFADAPGVPGTTEDAPNKDYSEGAE